MSCTKPHPEAETEVLPVVHDDPEPQLAAELAAAAPRRWWNGTSLVLLALALSAGGFLGGVQAQQHWGHAAATAPTSHPSAEPTASTSFNLAPTAADTLAGPGTTGTLTSITANTLTVRTNSGTVVKIKIAPSTRIEQVSTPAKLTVGHPVVVHGSAGTDGTLTAATVNAF